MALSQKHRSVLFDYLSPRVGEDTAEALMAEFPANEGDELVTKSFLRAELAEMKADLRGEMAGLRTDMTADMAGLRTDMANLRSDLTTRMVGVTAVATAVIVAFGR